MNKRQEEYRWKHDTPTYEFPFRSYNSYVCLRLDKSFFINFLSTSNSFKILKVVFILPVVLYFFCSIEVLKVSANLANLSRVFSW